MGLNWCARVGVHKVTIYSLKLNDLDQCDWFLSYIAENLSLTDSRAKKRAIKVLHWPEHRERIPGTLLSTVLSIISSKDFCSLLNIFVGLA